MENSSLFTALEENKSALQSRLREEIQAHNQTKADIRSKTLQLGRVKDEYNTLSVELVVIEFLVGCSLVGVVFVLLNRKREQPQPVELWADPVVALHHAAIMGNGQEAGNSLNARPSQNLRAAKNSAGLTAAQVAMEAGHTNLANGLLSET